MEKNIVNGDKVRRVDRQNRVKRLDRAQYKALKGAHDRIEEHAPAWAD